MSAATESMQERVCKLIADEIGEETVELDARLDEDLSMDSLDKLEVVCRLEDELDISIDDKSADRFTTVRDVVQYVEGLK